MLRLGGETRIIQWLIVVSALKNSMRYFSTFSGIGGFELGIYNAYVESMVGKSIYDISKMDLAECVGYSEIDKYAIQIYKKYFNHKNYGEISQIKAEELPDFDLLVGGFPCQAFSIAGKRMGFSDTRGTLFFEIARIIREKQPRLLLLENVKGLLSHDKGRTFYTIISTLDELGYDCQWQVLNSKNHGVAQNRERVFIIGHLRGTSRPQVFPFGESNKEVGGTNEGRTSKCAQTITGQGGSKDRLEKRQNGRRFKEDGEPSFTLTAQDKHGIYDGVKIRRLTPTECERLQGFPSGWTGEVSDTQRYKTLGNAVTVNVIKDIMERLM